MTEKDIEAELAPVLAADVEEQVLEAMTRLQGKEHPNTLTSMLNLAQVLQAEGDWAEAERLYRLALEGRKRVLGADHPDTLTEQCHMLDFCIFIKDATNQSTRSGHFTSFSMQEFELLHQPLNSSRFR